MDRADLDLRNATYRRFVALGQAPTSAEVAATTGVGEVEVRAGWRRLHEAHALVLDDAGEIRMANPFAARPPGGGPTSASPEGRCCSMPLDTYADRVDCRIVTSALSEPLAATVIVLDEAGRATLTDIAKVAGRSVSTIQRAVQALEADAVVRREMPRGPIVFRPGAPRAALREVADWSLGRSRAADLARSARILADHQPAVPATIRDPVIRAAWPATIDAIVRRFGPTRVILFGSQASGDARRDSDVDLLVTFEEVADRRERAIEIASLLRSAPFAKDILVASERDAARPVAGTAIADALRDGLVVYGR